MVLYDVEEISIGGVKVKFDTGYLTVEESGYQKSWKIELFGINPSLERGKLTNNSPNVDCEIKTKGEDTFKGKAVFESYFDMPLGDKTILLGDGPLKDLNISS